FARGGSGRVGVAVEGACGASRGGAASPRAATRNVESVRIDADTGQITVAFTPRVAAAGSNTLVLVPSAPDKPDAPTARVPLKRGATQAGAIAWECFAAGKAASSLPAPGAGPLPADAATLPAKYAPAECRA
ncbi:pilin, partial [Burkholderia pseudomultivorans]|uniref:pilin n=1 Tax=Burkholderia pseudomultivorans TaxID=1207504 RepID=UPI00287410FD